MSFGYPVMLEIRGRRCVVIGELAVGEGKVEGLLAAGADDVVVIGPEVDDRFEGVAGVTVERAVSVREPGLSRGPASRPE